MRKVQYREIDGRELEGIIRHLKHLEGAMPIEKFVCWWRNGCVSGNSMWRVRIFCLLDR